MTKPTTTTTTTQTGGATRFDYIQYDEQARAEQSEIKAQFTELADTIDRILPVGRPKSTVMTKLEEAYMWVGKGIRDAQIARTPHDVVGQEQRSAS